MSFPTISATQREGCLSGFGSINDDNIAHLGVNGNDQIESNKDNGDGSNDNVKEIMNKSHLQISTSKKEQHTSTNYLKLGPNRQRSRRRRQASIRIQRDYHVQGNAHGETEPYVDDTRSLIGLNAFFMLFFMVFGLVNVFINA